MKWIILSLVILGSAAGCGRMSEQYSSSCPGPGVITHASVEASIQDADQPAIDPALVQGLLPAEQCRPVVLTVNGVKVTLLGFDPAIEVVNRDTYSKETWASVSLKGQRGCFLMVRQDGDDLRGMILPYRGYFPSNWDQSFEDIQDRYGDQMIWFSPDKIYVEPELFEQLKARQMPIPNHWEPIPEVDYSHIHDYTKD